MTDRRPVGGPPRWAEYLLRSVLRPQDRDVITGDLLEEHAELQQTGGRWLAQRRYIAQVISLVVVEARRRIALTYVLAGCWVILFFGLLRIPQTPPYTPVDTEPLDPPTFLFLTAILLVAVVGGVFLVAGWLWFVILTQRRGRPVAPRSSIR